MTDTTHAVWIDRTGPADSLTLRDTPLPPPGPGEVRVRIEAAGVAYADVVMRNGLYPGAKAPVVPGYDFCGRIEALGPEVTGLAVGQRVCAVTVTGSYARHRNVSAALCVTAPEGPPADKIVAACMNGLTAYQMFNRCVGPEPGETVLVHGAAGGVGTLLLDLARLVGVKAIGTASQGKHGFLEARGATPIDYRTQDFVAETQRLTPGGVVGVFDHIGGKHFKRSLSVVQAGGTGVLYGGYDATKGGKPNPLAFLDLLFGSGLNAFQLFGQSRSVVGYNVQYWRDARPAAYVKDLAALMALVGDGRLDPEIGAVLPLERAGEAHRMLETASVAGKIVLNC